MTYKISLEKKLENLWGKFPGVKEKLKPSKTGSWGIHLSCWPEDVTYLETGDYQVVVSKWEQHCWTEGGGGIEWTEWLSVHYKEKHDSEEIKKLETEKIVTRDQHNPYKDLNHLWLYDFAGIEQLSEDKFLVYWKDGEGNKGPSYELELKK